MEPDRPAAADASTAIEAEYIGSRTVHADSSTAVNVPVTFGGARPYPQLNAFTTIRWDGWATFNALTLKATRRFARGPVVRRQLHVVEVHG